MIYEIKTWLNDTNIMIHTFEAKNRAGALNDFVLYMFEDPARFATLKSINKIEIKEKQ